MSEVRPTRPTGALLLSIWLIIVFCWGSFGLIFSVLLAGKAGMPALPTAQLGLAVLSLLLALGGGITLLQMNPLSWQLLIGRVVVDAIAIVMVTIHPVALPASVTSDPNAGAMTSMIKTGGTVFGVVMLIVNIGLALYARSVTAKAASVESDLASA